MRYALERTRVLISRPATSRTAAHEPSWPCVVAASRSLMPPPPSPRRRRPGRRRLTTSRNSSVRLTRRRANSCTGPVASAACRTLLLVGARRELDDGHAAVPGRPDHAGDAVGPARRPPAGRRPGAAAARRPAARRRCRTATMRPSLTMPTRSQSRSTRSSWWLENTVGTPSADLVPQHLAHHVDGDRVKPGERLVEHEDLAGRGRARRRAGRAAGCRG